MPREEMLTERRSPPPVTERGFVAAYVDGAAVVCSSSSQADSGMMKIAEELERRGLHCGTLQKSAGVQELSGLESAPTAS